MAGMNSAKTSRTATDNPLLENWTSPFGVPPFARIRPEHFLPAFTTAFAAHAAEVAAIASDPAEPSFANTIEALEQAGETLNRISNTFHVLAKAHTNDALLAAERELAPERALVSAVLDLMGHRSFVASRARHLWKLYLRL